MSWGKTTEILMHVRPMAYGGKQQDFNFGRQLIYG
jgi:hypothetical protein